MTVFWFLRLLRHKLYISPFTAQTRHWEICTSTNIANLSRNFEILSLGPEHTLPADQQGRIRPTQSTRAYNDYQNNDSPIIAKVSLTIDRFFQGTDFIRRRFSVTQHRPQVKAISKGLHNNLCSLPTIYKSFRLSSVQRLLPRGLWHPPILPLLRALWKSVVNYGRVVNSFLNCGLTNWACVLTALKRAKKQKQFFPLWQKFGHCN